MRFRPCFEAATKAAKSGWNALSEAEKWDWHGDLCGWRRVFLGIERDNPSSPHDPAGEWFDPQRADMAERYYRMQIEEERKTRERHGKETKPENRKPLSEAEMIRGGRVLLHEWANNRGHKNIVGYMAAHGLDFEKDEDYGKVCNLVASSIIAENSSMPKETGSKPAAAHLTAAALGVTAREYAPTSEQLRAGRVALGLEPAA